MVYCILYSSVLGEPLINAVGFRLRKSDSGLEFSVLKSIMFVCSAQCDPTTDLTAHVRPAAIVRRFTRLRWPTHQVTADPDVITPAIYEYTLCISVCWFFLTSAKCLWVGEHENILCCYLNDVLYLKGLVVIFMSAYIQSFLRIHYYILVS